MRRTIAMTAACVVTLATVGVASTPAQAAPSAPGSARAVRATAVTAHGLQLSWTNPGKRNFTRSEIRVADGLRAPRNANEGRRVAFVPARNHSLTVRGLKSASAYSFAVFATDGGTHRARPATARTTTLLDAPTSPRAYDGGSSTIVAWRNPAPTGLARTVVRYNRGAAAPTSPTTGTGAPLPKATGAQVVLGSLVPESGYSVSIFAVDRSGRASAPAVVRFTTTPKGPVSAPRPGTYSGRVVDTDGNPLVGADVVAYRYTDDNDDEVDATTGADGAFVLSLPPGDWSVGAAGAHASGGNSDRTGYVFDFDDDITVAPGAAVSGEPLVLAPGALVTGRVVDTAGHAVAGALPYLGYLEPYVQTSSGSSFGLYSSGAGEDRTDSDGTFTLRGVDSGDAFQLCASAQNATVEGTQGTVDLFNRCAKRSTVVAPGTSTTLPDLALTRAAASGTVTGHVRGVNGHAISGTAYLDPVRTNTAGKGGYGVSAGDGSFTIAGVAPGGYHVCGVAGPASGGSVAGYQSGCSSATVIVHARATVRGDVNLAIGAAVGGRVAGPDGTSLDGVEVSVATASDDDEDDGFGTSTTTDSRGRWSVLGLPAGDYSVCFDNGSSTGTPTGVLTACRPGNQKISLVTGRLRTGIDQKLAAAGAIAGVVTDASGRPAPYVDISTGDRFDDDGEYTGDDGEYTQSDRTGHYVLRGLTAGPHQVCYGTEDYDTTGVEGCLSTKPTVRLGRVTGGADITLPNPTAISVHVVDTDGTPVAAVNAAALAPCTGEDEDEDCDTNPVLGAKIGIETEASRLTYGDGTALLDGLTPGKHAVCLFAFYGTTVSGGSPTGYADACHGGQSFDVSVTRGATTAVTMVLQRGGSVSGKVTDTAGHPVADARVLVEGSAADDYTDQYEDFGDDDGYDDGGSSGGDFGWYSYGDDGSSPRSGSLTAADGSYSVIGVRPGARTVCVDPRSAAGTSAGYLAQCLGAAAGTTSGGAPVTVTAGTDTGAVDLRVTPGAALTGRVTAGGRALVDAQVVVFRGRKIDDNLRYDYTGSDGRWTVGRLPAGNYTACAIGEDVSGLCWHFVLWADVDENPPLAKAVLIPVSAGATRSGIDFALSRR